MVISVEIISRGYEKGFQQCKKAGGGGGRREGQMDGRSG